MAKQVRPAFYDSAKRSDPSRSSPYKEPERAYSIMARADIPLTDRPDIYLQSSLQAIIVSSLANRVESIYTLAACGLFALLLPDGLYSGKAWRLAVQDHAEGR